MAVLLLQLLLQLLLAVPSVGPQQGPLVLETVRWDGAGGWRRLDTQLRPARVVGLPPLPLDWGAVARRDATLEVTESLGESTLVYWAPSVRSEDGAGMRALGGAGQPQELRRERCSVRQLVSFGEEQAKLVGSGQARAYRYAGTDPAALLSDAEVERCLPVNRTRPGSVTSLWFASAGTAAQLHYDTSHNLFRQLHGTKRFRLLSPASAAATSLFPSFSPAQRQSRVPSLPDQMLTVDLHPGETLFLPAYTLHHVSTPADSALAVGTPRIIAGIWASLNS